MTAAETTFPKLVCCTKVDTQHEKEGQANEFFDVKFWPYLLENGESIFAVAGNREVFIYQTVTGGEAKFKIINWWHDTNLEASVNSIVWIQDARSGKPLLCMAGAELRHITVMDISNGTRVRTLTGHGRNVNELVVSPTDPTILASCSEDFTIRLWNMEPEFEDQPCVAILAGEGHRQPLLACAFHPNGKWILSGAMDTAVALWAVPPPEVLSRRGAKDDEPAAVTYPHFLSIEIHHNYVDSLAFYGDLIVSRCAQSQNDATKQHEILLWKIDGFNANEAPTKDIAVATPGRKSRSSFPHEPLTQGFTRLLSLSMPYTDRFYQRFGLFHAPELRPMLCMGSQLGKYSFWDLQKFESPYIVANKPTLPGFAPRVKGIAKKVPLKRKADGEGVRPALLNPLDREDSVVSSNSRETGPGTPSLRLGQAQKRSVLDDPLQQIKPHHVVAVAGANGASTDKFGTFTSAWSPDGHWVVGVGDNTTLVMMYREEVI